MSLIFKKYFLGLLLVSSVVISGYSYKIYQEHKQQKVIKQNELNKVKKALNKFPDIKEFTIIDSEKMTYNGQLHIDYIIEGSMKNNNLFRAYLQFHEQSNQSTGISLKSGGYANCGGSYINPRLNLCR